LFYAIKLFLAVFLLIAVAAPLLRKPFSGLLPATDYKRIWFVILGSAAVSFLSLVPTVFAAGVAVGALIASNLFGGDIKARLAAFWLLLLLFPPVSLSIDGVAGLNRLIQLSPARVLGLVLLLPAALSLAGNRHIRVPAAMRWTDLLVLAYPALRIAVAIPTTTLTGTLRTTVEMFIDVLLPYFVTTRGLHSASDLKFVASRVALGFVFMAVVGLMEAVLRKNVYTELEFIYGTRWTTSHELWRGPFLRIDATTSQPIIMAFVMMCAFGIWSWLRATGSVLVRQGRLIAVVIFLAFFLTWSRGPLLGLACLVLSFGALRWMSPMTFLSIVSVFVVAGCIAVATGADNYLYDALKALFGSEQADTSSIDYRRKLLDTSFALIKQSPVWGVPNYGAYLQELRQGEGIIDIVNTYVAVMLGAGIVGLVCFLSPYLLVLVRLLRRIGPKSERPRLWGGSFPVAFAALTIAALFVIFTTSTFSLISSMLLFIVAVPTAWLAMTPEEQKLADARDEVAEAATGRGFPVPDFASRGVW
jgi:hypothetical protein